MTILSQIPNGASLADIRATLNNLFGRIETREGGTMAVLARIPNGARLQDIRQTINDALTRIAALEAGTTTPTPTPSNTYANSTQVRANNSAFQTLLGAMESKITDKGA